MNLQNVKENVVVEVSILNGVADNEVINGAEVDMQGFEGVAFYATVEEGEAIACSMKAQQDVVTGMAGAADLEGTSVLCSPTIPAKGEAILDIWRPQERFVRPVLTVGDLTAPSAVCVVAVKYGYREVPVTQPGAAEFHSSPDEGTA